MPAAPHPVVTILTSSSRLPTTRKAFSERCEHADRGAVLVVVEHGNVELGLQALFHLEAAGSRDVLEVDAAEAGRDRLHRRHDLVGILRRERDREGINVAELLEEHCLALHHGQRGFGADVAQAEHGRAVGDDRDHVLLRRQ